MAPMWESVQSKCLKLSRRASGRVGASGRKSGRRNGSRFRVSPRRHRHGPAGQSTSRPVGWLAGHLWIVGLVFLQFAKREENLMPPIATRASQALEQLATLSTARRQPPAGR